MVEDLHHGRRELHQLPSAAGQLNEAGEFGLEQNFSRTSVRDTPNSAPMLV